ncbi:BsuPI-related putative proteinase inhibitor [Selenihalanaerobacter shriftii]|uniref:LysM domain-containing protein n=1 Tax=Selenihalanaerobacter shriftii TaxID=142842 RepID=A0A1T4LPZ2_9FIRM|nr:BsuPI-related putative proteinase inhibitor [Selenihalanaerobacter shriftii]SJZ56706.1 LysM domain-containing protein [Selenihalanaerobacter shriftii]
MEYVVKRGDTLYKIARRFNTTVAEIVEANQLQNINVLEVGQVIIIPVEDHEDMEEIIEDREDIIEEDVTVLPTQNFDYEIVNGLLIILFTDEESYEQGENIRLNLVKVNISRSSIALNYNSGQRFEFIARKSGRRIWTWSQDRSFAQVTKRITLEPEEAVVYRAIWDQQNNNNQQIETGRYRIQGWNTAQQLEDNKLDIFLEIE